MNAPKELRPEEIKKIFERAASVESVPAVEPMLSKAQTKTRLSFAWMPAVAVVAVASIALFSIYQEPQEKSASKISLVHVNQPSAMPSTIPMASSMAASMAPSYDLIQMAAEAAERGDFIQASELAKQAGDEKMTALYISEDIAKEFVPLCADAFNTKKLEDVYPYCYEALRDLTETKTYKQNKEVIQNAKSFYQEQAGEEARVAITSAERLAKSTDMKQLAQARAEVNLAKEKLSQIEKFSGASEETAALKKRIDALTSKVTALKAFCDEDTCAKGSICDVDTGTCKTNKASCDESVCINGCANDGKTCKSIAVSLSCDTRCANGCKPDGSCKDDGAFLTSAEREALLLELKSTIAQTDGCATIGKDIEKLRAIAPADYWYFKGYCASDSNPEKACDYYVKFLKTAKSDPRAARVKTYVSSQDSSTYPTCVLP